MLFAHLVKKWALSLTQPHKTGSWGVRFALTYILWKALISSRCGISNTSCGFMVGTYQGSQWQLLLKRIHVNKSSISGQIIVLVQGRPEMHAFVWYQKSLKRTWVEVDGNNKRVENKLTCSDHCTRTPNICVGIWIFWRKLMWTLAIPLKQKPANQKDPIHFWGMNPFCYIGFEGQSNTSIFQPFSIHSLQMKLQHQPAKDKS